MGQESKYYLITTITKQKFKTLSVLINKLYLANKHSTVHVNKTLDILKLAIL